LTRIARLLAFILMAGTMIAAAQSAEGPASPGPVAANYVAQVRDARNWEFGPFFSAGTGVGDRVDYRFLSAGLQFGKTLTPVLHASIFSGQFELGGNIMPLWQSYTPAPHTATFTCIVAGQPVVCVLPVAGGTYTGVSITPAIFRWNFLTRSTRIQPWFQGAGGLIYTTRQYPPSFSSTPSFTVDGSTSVWNFSPQGGVGFHYFIFPKRSIDVGLNAVHISSASLGDRNPGVNASLLVQVGLTRWR